MSITVAEFRKIARKPRKYRNTPKQVDGHHFASKAEARRYQDLRLLEHTRKISGLKLQPVFRLNVHGVHVCDYIADFEYYEKGERVIEDYKGFKTREYLIKRRLMKAIFGIEVRET